MKSNYIVRATHFLHVIYPYLEGNCESPWGCRQAVREYCVKKTRKVFVYSGVSRIAIVTSDYAIKFDYDEHEVRRVGGCESEVNFYQFAKKAGYAHLFAEITPIEYMGRKFYIMPRIENIRRVEDSYADEFFDGAEKAFLESYVDDLHDGNYGWFNRTPVIFDYACNKLWCDSHEFDTGWSTPTTMEEVSES
jgi:hypothetical protein